MNSGIELSAETIAVCKKVDKKELRFVVLKPSADGTAVEIEAEGDREKTWDEMCQMVAPEASR